MRGGQANTGRSRGISWRKGGCILLCSELPCTGELHKPINSLSAAASLMGVPVTATRRVTNRGRDVGPLFTTTRAGVVVGEGGRVLCVLL